MSGSDGTPTPGPPVPSGRAGRADEARSSGLRARVAASVAAARQKFDDSIGGSLWRRLTAIDFINRGIQLAAVQLLCLLPFLIIARRLTDQKSVADFIERFGLNHDAADDVRKALVPPASNSLTALSYVLFVLSGFAVAGAVQELYEKTFDLPGRGLKDTPRRLIWLLALTAATAFSGTAGSWLHDTGGPILFGSVVLIGATCFWWLSMWLLLGGRLSWRELFPSALATGVCWLGMTITFRLTLSGSVITDHRKYGGVGVIIAFMSYLIAVGVVIVLGAVVGMVWRERREQPAASVSMEQSTREPRRLIPNQTSLVRPPEGAAGHHCPRRGSLDPLGRAWRPAGGWDGRRARSRATTKSVPSCSSARTRSSGTYARCSPNSGSDRADSSVPRWLKVPLLSAIAHDVNRIRQFSARPSSWDMIQV